MAEPVIGAVLKKAQYLTDNCKLPKAAQKMVKKLANKLKDSQENVKEVEKIAIIENRALADWLRMLKDTVYDAEDVLDNMEATSVDIKVQEKNKVSKFASFDENLESLKMVVDQLDKFSTDIPKIFKLVNMIENNKFHTREVTNSRETISVLFGKAGLYGRQVELNQILEIILSSELKSSKMGGHGLLVIPIVGMGGVGKTALAQAVYNHPDVQQTYAKRAWISVSNNCDIVLVMSKICQSLSEHPVSYLSQVPLEVISKKLSATIDGVKFLIVLDNMFESQWDVLYKFLSCGAPGSVVLITTQNQVFANRFQDPIALSTLNSDVFWNLFEHFAFRNKEIHKGKSLKSIGKKIADKLHGLPLSAKIIGNILRSNMDEDSWIDISNREWWDIPEAKSRILPTIALGYEQLDPCLRQCFAYCSLFPRNSLIEKDRLVHMWIAQNFIQCDVNGTMRLEDIGRQWFDELVEKSFFQRSGDNNSYVMHDLMHDLAVIVSSGECFYLGEGVNEIPLGVRHLAVDINNLEVIKVIQKHNNLRSFLYFGCCQVKGMYSSINDMLSNLSSIRVLDLSYMSMDISLKPPTSFWNLQHLRFLDIPYTGIELLTHTSINHYHLQALYIRKCNFRVLPSSINKLINLRHLFADEGTVSEISGIGQLTNLQELGAFYVGKKEGHRITELRNLREIRGTLRIKNYYQIENKDDAKLANLVDKKHLDCIHLENSHIRGDNMAVEVLEELQPHKDIKDLRINSYNGSVFPNWIIQIGNFLNLNTVYLSSCDYVEVLPPLGELPSLKLLHIESCSSIKLIDYHLYGEKQTVFPLLEELYLFGLQKCEEWIVPQTREFFPSLSKLTITCNYNLKEAPFSLFSSSLKELIIRFSDSLISLENSIPHLSFLTCLDLRFSPARISFNPLDMPLLEYLYLEHCSEFKIKGDLQSLNHLKHLKLVSCSKLYSEYSSKDQQKGKGLQVNRDAGLRSLTHIEADKSLLHHQYHLILGSLPSLRVLNFIRSEFTQFTNDQILWFQELTELEEIYFENCKFEHLPASLTLLSSLKKVVLHSCTKLKSISNTMPPNLQELILYECSKNLVQLCQEYKDQDLHFISSIPVIHVYDNTTPIRKLEQSIKHQIKSEFHVTGEIDLSTPHRKLPQCIELLESEFHVTGEIDLSTPYHKLRRGLVQSFAIRKPQISDAIGHRACASCSTTFELTDLVLYDFDFDYTKLGHLH